MKLADPTLRQMLAGEYVLGTLAGRARRRFEQQMREVAPLRAEVEAWERKLAPLVRRFAPRPPRAVVWAAIDRQVNASKVKTLPPRRTPDVWRGWAIAATVASVALSVALWQQSQRPPEVLTQTQTVRVEVPAPMPYVAMLKPGTTDATYLVAMMPEKHMMKVSLSAQVAMAPEKPHSLELWVIDDGGKPHSLGVLPDAPGEMQMPLPMDMPMPTQVLLAVSMEPPGGSPTGAPTGPVLTSGHAMRAS
jgi:anti-sigma-K factor RskA